MSVKENFGSLSAIEKQRKGNYFMHFFGLKYITTENLPSGIFLNLGTSIIYEGYYYIVTEINHIEKEIYLQKTIKY